MYNNTRKLINVLNLQISWKKQDLNHGKKPWEDSIIEPDSDYCPRKREVVGMNLSNISKDNPFRACMECNGFNYNCEYRPR